MRFTKIPLIATLMAVALSLLIVLPTIAQTSDITDGKGSSGPISVGVFDDINDAQKAKLVVSTFDFSAAGTTAPDPLPYIPRTDGTTPEISGVSTAGTFEATHAPYLTNPAVDPRDTFFRSTLYVSNNPANDGDEDPDTTTFDATVVGAYNTILINVAFDEVLGGTTNTTNCELDVDPTVVTGVDESKTALVRAIVRNNRSGEDAELELVLTRVAASGTTPARTDAQGFVKVVQDAVNGVRNEATDGPIFCADSQRTADTNDDDAIDASDDPTETEATTATDATIAQIPARHGDRITITVPGQSGTVELTVDGNGPDFTAITPEDNDVTRSSRLSYSFEVRDDDSGLRHDGEAILTEDDDYEEVNPDGDHVTTGEPLSEDPGAAVNANGPAADIDVRVAPNPMSTTPVPTAATYKDISASGTWRIAGSRAGVAYSFSASGADKDNGPYLYQLQARDRAGNWTVTDADDSRDAGGDQPFVFRVDNRAPSLLKVRTGISWDSENDKEKVDRSYLALEFTDAGGPDPLGDVDTGSITVVSNNVVGFIHPSRAPAINRNEGAPNRANYDPTVIRYSPAERTDPDDADVTDASGVSSGESRTASQHAVLINDGRFTRYTATQTIIDALTAEQDAAEPEEPTTAEPDDCDVLAVDDLSATDVQLCGEWVEYEAELALFNTGKSDKEAADARHTADSAAFTKSFVPGADITGTDFAEPRARVYIELAEDLASDATPTVQVVGGAVRDLAGNANEAKTLSPPQVEDWIAPSLTVTVTGTASDREVANGKGAFTVDVMADEDVSRPRVFFVSLAAAVNEDKDGYDYTIGSTGTNEANALTAQEQENHWRRAYKVSSADLSGFSDGLVGVIVATEDDADNSGATAGWSPSMHRGAPLPTMGNKLTPSKMHSAGLLVEIDKSIPAADEVFVTPRSDADGTATESPNPFVKLSFKSEGGEYEVCPATDGCPSGLSSEFKDSHSRVDVSSITVDGDDELANLARISANEFSLVLRDLEVGDHKVSYVVTDDAGNKSDVSTFTFEVFPRRPYKVDVTPGWNLISLPGTPIDSAIGDVLVNNPYINQVLGYQDGDWLTAVQEEPGSWRGRLTEIEGGFGYWLHTRTFSTISTMLAETDPATTLPTVRVSASWNLLGVLDVHQNAQGMAPGETTRDDTGASVVGNPEADDYFTSIPWKVAYTYDTTASLWVKTVPGDADDMVGENGEILNGNGYWVWSTSPSTLAP